MQMYLTILLCIFRDFVVDCSGGLGLDAEGPFSLSSVYFSEATMSNITLSITLNHYYGILIDALVEGYIEVPSSGRQTL